jgi:hypothetical protein
MPFIPSPNMLFRPLTWWRYWVKIYAQWEFWAIAIVVLTAYSMLKTLNLLPEFLMNDSNAKWLTTTIILLPMPYLISRKEHRLKGKDDWFVRALPYTIAGLLLLTSICFLLPIFSDATNKHALSGTQMIIRNPFVAGVPIVYLLSAALLVRDYNEWRSTALFWIFGGFAGMWSAALAYTSLQPKPDPVSALLYNTLFTLPILAWFLCFIKQQPESHPINKRLHRTK